MLLVALGLTRERPKVTFVGRKLPSSSWIAEVFRGPVCSDGSEIDGTSFGFRSSVSGSGFEKKTRLAMESALSSSAALGRSERKQ